MYTGQTASRVGSASAQASRSVIIGGSQPAVSVSTHSLDFGTIAIGHTSLPQAITVTNSGQAPLVISSAVLAGANKGDYNVTGDTCSGHTIAAGGTCTTTLTFTPGGTGARVAQLGYTDNASGSPHTIALSGSGTHRVTLAGTRDAERQPRGGRGRRGLSHRGRRPGQLRVGQHGRRRRLRRHDHRAHGRAVLADRVPARRT